MKHFCILLLLNFQVFSQMPSWRWVDSPGNTRYCEEVATDKNGNVYVTGGYWGSISFGTKTYTASNSHYDFFIAKYDSLGNVLWSHVAKSKIESMGQDIATDNAGNIYVTGYFFVDTFQIGNIVLTNAPGKQATSFLMKFSPSGNLLWAKAASGEGTYTYGWSLSVTPKGEVFVAGVGDVRSLSFGGITLSSSVYDDLYVFKFNSSGNAYWGKSFGGYSRLSEIDADQNGDLLLTGEYFPKLFSYDSLKAPTLSTWDQEAFLLKIDGNGKGQWLKTVSGKGFESGVAVKTDQKNHVYLTGSYTSTLLTSGTDTLENSLKDHSDIFLCKYDAKGSLIWHKTYGGADDDRGVSLSVDRLGSMYLGASMQSTIITIENQSFGNVSSDGIGTEILILKYRHDGLHLWTKQTGDDGSEMINGLSSGPGGLYVCGYNSASVFFDSIQVINPYHSNMFVGRIGDSWSGIDTDIEENRSSVSTVRVFPNPVNETLYLNADFGIKTVCIYNMLGSCVQSVKLSGSKSAQLTTSGLKAGIYYLDVTGPAHRGSCKVVKE